MSSAGGAAGVADYFSASPAPPSCAAARSTITSFVQSHCAVGGRRLVLVTSGGTTVPLERNTVRFIDNFSTGSRGGKSAECFLEQGYAVIFLHRAGSIEPFQQARDLFSRGVLDSPETTPPTGDGCKWNVVAELSPAESELVGRLLALYRGAVLEERRLLKVPFTSVHEYLHMLRDACTALQPAGARAMVYLAAAVSDYFVPDAELAEHKIQSSSGDLALTLRSTPKCLRALKAEWAPAALVTSFKLETDDAILLSKASGAIEKYGVDLVVANLLHSRNELVQVVAAPGAPLVPRDAPGLVEGGAFNRVELRRPTRAGAMIETPLVEFLSGAHARFMGE